MAEEVIAKNIEDLAQKVLDDTVHTFSGQPTIEQVAALVGRVSKWVDNSIAQSKPSNPGLACKKGCCWCCHEIVLATTPEILSIYHHVLADFDEDEKRRLLERIEAYDLLVAPKRNAPFYFTKAPCPFLLNSQCTIYDARPLVCRGRNSNNVELCRMWKESPGEGGIVEKFIAHFLASQAGERGLSMGFNGRYESTRYELGRCLKMLFEDPSLADRVMKGIEAFPSPAPKPQPYVFQPDSHSISPPVAPHPLGTQAQKLIDAGNFVGADELCPPNTLLGLFNRLRLPRIYSSFDQVLEARQRMDAALDDLGDRLLNIPEAISALHDHLTLALPYHGLSARNLLEKQGRIFFHKIVSQAYPHLCVPFETRRRPGKFRLGYMSGSLDISNATRWALGWLRNHGPEMETFAFNWGKEDIGSQWWAEAADHYYCLRGNLQRAAEHVRKLDLDALIITDVGYRPNDYIVYCMRLARVQCTAWGTPLTSGLPTIDYYLTSDLMEPADAQREYTEKLVRLPRSGLCYPRPKSKMPVQNPPPNNASFEPLMAQNIRKWTPQSDALLKRIAERHARPLRMVALREADQTSTFSARLASKGIAHEILPYTNSIGFASYLQLADVSFDPPDWSGGNTTIEALSYGVPVVTLPGHHMRGRHSLAFLKIANAEGLIALDEDDYIELIFDRDRQREAMKDLNLDALYDDKGVVEALDRFLLEASATDS